MDQKTNRLIDVDATPEQIEAALQCLEAEKRKRLEARVAAREVVTVPVTVLNDQDEENLEDKTKALVLDLVRIDTGVPRSTEGIGTSEA
jgi:hypothetical protein